MLLLGLTGGVGMGKSTAAEMLTARGLPLIDTDLLARELVQPGQEALSEIRAAFGNEVLDESGRLRRDVMAGRVFANPADRQRLEAILHPRIRAAWESKVRQWREDAVAAGVVVIPLLFETSATPLFDATLCVACSSDEQQRRLTARGWSDTQIQQRNDAQWPIKKKMTASTFVIWTEGDLDLHRRQLARVLSILSIHGSA